MILLVILTVVLLWLVLSVLTGVAWGAVVRGGAREECSGPADLPLLTSADR